MSRDKRYPSVMFTSVQMSDTSTMDSRELSEIQEKCIFDDFHRAIVAPGSPNVLYDNGVICFRDQLRYGLRFPLCPELVTILCYYNIIPAQIFPTSLGQMMAFISFLRRRKLKWSATLFCHLFEYSINRYDIFRFFSSQLNFRSLPSQTPGWMDKYFLVIRDSVWPIKTKPSETYSPMYLRGPRRMNVEERDSFFHAGEFPLDFNELVSWADCCDLGMTYRIHCSSYHSPMQFDEPQEEEGSRFLDDYSKDGAASELSPGPLISVGESSSPIFLVSPARGSEYLEELMDPASSRDDMSDSTET